MRRTAKLLVLAALLGTPVLLAACGDSAVAPSEPQPTALQMCETQGSGARSC